MSNLAEAIDKNLKELNSLSKAVRDYGEKALTAMEKKTGSQPDASEPEALVKYCDNVLIMLGRAQGKLVEAMTLNNSSDKKVDVSPEEKWLFFYRYQQYISAVRDEAASRI